MRLSTMILLAACPLLAALLIAAPELGLTPEIVTVLGATGCGIAVCLLAQSFELASAAAAALVSAALLSAWWITPGTSDEGLRHLGGAVAGLLMFASVRQASTVPWILQAGTQLIGAAAVAALTVGLFSVNVDPGKQLLGLFGQGLWHGLPRAALPVEGLVDGMVNANALAGAALLLGPLLAGLGLNAWSAQRRAAAILPGLGVLLAAACVLVSLSRTAVCAAVAVALVAGTRWPSSGRPVRAALLIAGGAGLIWFLMPWTQSARVAVFEQSAHTMGLRLAFWNEAVALLSQHPLQGIGINQFHPLDDAHAENIYLQTALDLGIPGAMVLFAFWARLGWMGWKTQSESDRHIRTGAALSILAVHLFGLTDAIALGSRVGLFQWIAGGLAAGAAGTGAATVRAGDASGSQGPARGGGS